MKRDVLEWFKSQQKQMNEMNDALERVKKQVDEGLIKPEDCETFANYYNVVKSNYDRVAYIVHLLMLPPKFIQKINEKKILADQKKFDEAVKKAAIEEENKKAIEEANKAADEMEKK